MAKIETYSLANVPLSLDDMLIGTDVTNPVVNATKNFSLGQLLNLYLPYIPSNTLQSVLNAGNTATQNIILTGSITSTSIKPVNITDVNSSNGTVGQLLSKQSAGIMWTTVYTLPSMTGNSGKFLTNNGSTASWVSISQVPSQSSQSGKYLTTDGTTASWASIPPSATTSNITADLAVGAINAGDVIASGTTLQAFIQKLVTITYNPTIVNPSFYLGSNASTVEVGTSVSFSLNFSFDRGHIYGSTSGTWNPYYNQGYTAGAATSYTINGTTQAGSSLLISGYTVLLGSNVFYATVTYGIGIQPLNSKGGNYSTPYPAGTSPSQNTSFEGIYPYFWYKSNSPISNASMQAAIASGAATKVVGDSTGTITINFAATGEYLAVAYPSTSATKTVWYVNALDNGSIPGGVFGSASILPCSSSSGYWSSVNYKIHVTAGLITQSNPMELRN